MVKSVLGVYKKRKKGKGGYRGSKTATQGDRVFVVG